MKSVRAAAVVFAVTGLVSATWAARLPATQQRLHLSTPDLGLAVLAVEGGALLGLPAGGILVARLGARRCLWLGFSVYAPALGALALAPSLAALCMMLAVWAAANSMIDVAMNAAGVQLERHVRRPVLSRLHAAQSSGLLTGGMIAAAAAKLQVPLGAHFGVVAVMSTVAALMATPRIPVPVIGHEPTPDRRFELRLLPLGLIAFCAFLIDGAAGNWAAVELHSQQQATPAIAAIGYTLFTLAMTTTRLLGDRILQRHSRTRITQSCGITTAAGAILVASAPTVTVAITGWIVVGAGLAIFAPTLLGAAPHRAPCMSPAAAIATVTTLGYFGSFTGPPIIGVLAAVIGLSPAVGLLAVAGLVAAAVARPALRMDGDSPTRVPTTEK